MLPKIRTIVLYFLYSAKKKKYRKIVRDGTGEQKKKDRCIDTVSIGRLLHQEETKMIKGTPALIAERREEIFLALFQREYDRWNEELEAIIEENDSLTREQVAEKIAHSLEKRKQLLKLLSMNNFDMEANSRQEMLTSFKASYGRSIRNIRGILDKFCTGMSDEDKQNFIYVFYPFMFGIYPYSEVTEKLLSWMHMTLPERLSTSLSHMREAAFPIPLVRSRAWSLMPWFRKVSPSRVEAYRTKSRTSDSG